MSSASTASNIPPDCSEQPPPSFSFSSPPPAPPASRLSPSSNTSGLIPNVTTNTDYSIFVPHQEIALTTLYVSSKLHDTLKKPRDIILASYAIRFPDLLKGRVAVDPATVDQKMLENDRRKVLSIERLVLETICFNFRLGDRSAFACVVKLAKALKRKSRD